jgi:hypothetical protein
MVVGPAWSWAKEHQVAGAEVGDLDVAAGRPLLARGPRQRQPGAGVGEADQPGAVERRRAGRPHRYGLPTWPRAVRTAAAAVGLGAGTSAWAADPNARARAAAAQHRPGRARGQGQLVHVARGQQRLQRRQRPADEEVAHVAGVLRPGRPERQLRAFQVGLVPVRRLDQPLQPHLDACVGSARVSTLASSRATSCCSRAASARAAASEVGPDRPGVARAAG